TVHEVQIATDLSRDVADKTLQRMAGDGEIVRVGRGRYALPSALTSEVSESPKRSQALDVKGVSSVSDTSDTSDTTSDNGPDFPDLPRLLDRRSPALGPPGDSLDDLR